MTAEREQAQKYVSDMSLDDWMKKSQTLSNTHHHTKNPKT